MHDTSKFYAARVKDDCELLLSTIERRVQRIILSKKNNYLSDAKILRGKSQKKHVKTTGDETVTYKYRVLRCLNEGVCKKDEHICSDQEKQAEICTMEYNPVCGDNDKTYGNPCSACASKEINSWTLGDC